MATSLQNHGVSRARTRTYKLHGGLCGPIWQPGPDCTMTLSQEIDHVGGDLPAVLASITKAAGDFWPGCRFTADTYVEIEHRRYRTRASGRIVAEYRHTRLVDLVDLPSVAALVDQDTYVWDGTDWDGSGDEDTVEAL